MKTARPAQPSDDGLDNDITSEKQINWVNVFFLFGLPVLALVVTPVYLYLWGWHWSDLVLFVTLGAVTNISITGGYHRYLSHRSYEASDWVKVLYLIFGAMAFQGSALVWATDHRKHHRYVDSNKDPHNIREGFFHAHMGWMLYKDNSSQAATYAPDLLKDKWILWQDRHYVLLATALCFCVPLMLGFACGNPVGGLVFGGLLRLLFTQHSTFFINSLAHSVGRQTYNEKYTARDSLLMALLAYGEGFHNFHHQFQADYRNGIRWYHWDPTKWTIQILALLGLARRLRQVSPGEILKARLQTEHTRLVRSGVPEEKLSALRVKIETAQSKFRELREEYKKIKANMQNQSREYVIYLRAEVKIARLEFKMAFAQWVAYRRAVKSLPLNPATV